MADLKGHSRAPNLVTGSGFSPDTQEIRKCPDFRPRLPTPGPTDRGANALLRLRDALKSRWTTRQRELITFYRAHPGYSYADLAEWLHKSPQAVHKRLKAASWDAVVEAERAAGALLRTATGGSDPINITGLKSEYQPHKVDRRRPR